MNVSNGAAKFTDVSAAQLPQQETWEWFTSALWTDFDNDGWIDLVVTGEFMPITFIKK